jgi:hypothetical protein
MIGKHLHELAQRAYLGIRDEWGTGVSRSLTQNRRFIENEVSTWGKGWLSMPVTRRLWLWRHGFLSRANVLYNVTEENYQDYLSDYQRERAAWLNSPRSIALDDKLIFHWMMEPFDNHRTATYGLLKGGRFHDVSTLGMVADGSGVVAEAAPDRSTDNAVEWVSDQLESEGTLVLKPHRGGGGKNVMFCSVADGIYRVNGEERTAAEFESMIADLDDYLVSEAVEQADYARELFPKSVNTLRILTMYDEEADEPYIPIVAHRIGNEQSAPVDNFSSGGLAAEVDRETGELSAAIHYPYAGELDWHETHPDTGAQIEGVTVPNWAAVREGMLDLAAAFSHTPYIGWDVVVTGAGEFTVIEANNSSDMDILQTHRPLLADQRARRFYERRGVVPAAESTRSTS